MRFRRNGDLRVREVTEGQGILSENFSEFWIQVSSLDMQFTHAQSAAYYLQRISFTSHIDDRSD